MQFSILATALLGLAANAAVLDATVPYEASPAEVGKRGELQRRADIANIEVFGSSGCSNRVVTWLVPQGARNGCFQLRSGGGTVASVRPFSVAQGCAVTIYTDSTCSVGARIANVGSCTSGTFRTYSVDGNC